MKIVEFTAVTVVLSSLLVLACTPEPADPGTSAEESGAATTEPSTGTESSGSAGETQAEPETSGSTTAAEPVPTTCAEATNPEQCNAIDNEFESCAWFETTRVADPGACSETQASGVCVMTARLDGCDEIFASDACSEGSGAWFVRLRDDGTIELLPDPSACALPDDFDTCPWYEEGSGTTGEPVDPALAEACACACSLASA